MSGWPNRDERERLEIEGFISAYSRLPHARRLEIVSKTEMPDYVVRDVATGDEYGVELTSVYVDDRSVPDHHMPEQTGPEWIPDDKAELARYLRRLLDAVEVKIQKACQGYRQDRPLILSIYVNEYVSIWLDCEELDRLVKANDSFFEDMSPFREIVFWNLPNGGVLSATPSRVNG